jgi:hypothetical protein
MSHALTLNPNSLINSSVPCLKKKAGGTTELHKVACLQAAFGTALPPGNIPIKDILEEIERCVQAACGKLGLKPVVPSAFSNSRGFWFEIMVTVALWNERVKNKKYHQCLVLKMPNVSGLKYFDLFEPIANNMLVGLEKALAANQVNLITSNPDLICFGDLQGVDPTKLFLKSFGSYGGTCFTDVSSAYQKVVGHCSYNSIKYGLGLKSSTRPDRRLQIPHEGSVVKAINAHLQTRFWDPRHQTKYYAAMAERPTGPDLEAFKTAATHSITNVNAPPMRAVDEAFYLETLDDVGSMLAKMMAGI